MFEPKQSASVVSVLKTMSSIETVQSVSGKIDLIARVNVKTPEDLDWLLDKIGTPEEGVKHRISTYFVN